MNLHEGTRRLALLLGVIGFIVGGVASYLELQNVLDQRMRHNKFEQLADSDTAKKAKPGPFGPAEPDDPWEKAAITDLNGTVPYEIDKDGIKKIHWTEDYNFESIETEDGQTLYPVSAPNIWLYLLIVLFPILGFFIPWGTIRAIGWVLMGFFAH